MDDDEDAQLPPLAEDDLKQYIHDISCFPKGCSPAEERVLASRIQAGDLEARNHLVNCNLSLVIYYAKQWRFHPPVTLLDLIAVGNEGLITAAKKFDSAKGRFSTYATWWIRQAMGRSYPELARSIALPVHYAEQVLKLQRLMDRLRVTLGVEEPELADVTRALYPDLWKEEEKREELLSRTKELLFWSRSMLSLDQNEREEDDPYTLADTLENTTFPTAERYIYAMGVCDEVREALKTLTPRQRLFITRLYTRYFSNGKGNLKECAASMGISRERGRQLYEESLERMHRYQDRWYIPAS